MKWLTLAIFMVYFTMAGYTTSDFSDHGLETSDRIIYADWIGLFIVLLGVVTLKKIKFSIEQFLYLAFLIFALFGVFTSRNPESGSIELVILAFNWVIALGLLHLMINSRYVAIADIVLVFLYATTLLAVAGLVKFFVLPELFGHSPGGALVGTFRNTGQAGAFFGVALAILVPAIMSGLIERRTINIVFIGVITTALMLTFKRAALIGFAVGLFLFLIKLAFSGSTKDKKTAVIFLAAAVFIAPLMYLVFQYSIENVAAMRWRFEYKFRDDAVEDFSEGFFSDNLNAAMAAVGDHPFFGAGLGNIIGQYTEKFELHSTYLSVLGNTGLVGLACYSIFMITWVVGIYRDAGKGSPETRFLSYVLPFIFGLAISWIYTYHLRKREFWIMFFIVLACRYAVEANRKFARQYIGYRLPPRNLGLSTYRR
jgi:O-antigen ligase